MKTFKIGGIHPEECKLSAGVSIEKMPLPTQVAIPVAQHIGAPATVVVAKGDKVKVKKMEVLSKQTTPPSYYTDAELIQAMQHAGKFVDDEKMKEVLEDAKGIGTSATRAGIIDDLIKKEFLYRNKKTIRATEFGIATIKSLEGKNVISPALTAEWEEKLQQIENGSLKTLPPDRGHDRASQRSV